MSCKKIAVEVQGVLWIAVCQSSNKVIFDLIDWV